jgi:hypothetical protein
VPLDADQCPADPEEIADRYCMGSLDRAQAVEFEDHYLTCTRCAAIVENTQHFVKAMKAAAERLRSAPPKRARTEGS